MKDNYPTSDGEMTVAERRDDGKGNNILTRKSNQSSFKSSDSLIPVRIKHVIKDDPENYTSICVKLLSGKVEWIPYEHCQLIKDILLVPVWFYNDRLSQGRW